MCFSCLDPFLDERWIHFWWVGGGQWCGWDWPNELNFLPPRTSLPCLVCFVVEAAYLGGQNCRLHNWPLQLFSWGVKMRLQFSFFFGDVGLCCFALLFLRTWEFFFYLDEDRRIISFRVCDLFLDPWFLSVVVFGVELLHISKLFSALSFILFLRFLLMVNSMWFLVFFFLHETFFESIPFHFSYNNKKTKMLMAWD